MNREELIVKAAEKSGVQLGLTKKVVAAVFDIIPEALENGDNVYIYRFGEFNSKISAERMVTSAVSGKTTKIPPRYRVCFRPHNSLRDRVRKIPIK